MQNLNFWNIQSVKADVDEEMLSNLDYFKVVEGVFLSSSVKLSSSVSSVHIDFSSFR